MDLEGHGRFRNDRHDSAHDNRHRSQYADPDGSAQNKLEEIAREARGKWKVQDIAISHRIGTLKVGDINLVVAVASAHRGEGFAACQYIIDRFKASLPTQKEELYIV